MTGLETTNIVACGTLRREIRRLAEDGMLSADKLLFTAPGLHEWPDELEKQLVRQLSKARQGSRQVVVAYGEKCFLDVANPARDTDALLREQGPEFTRVSAKNCVDMLASKEERDEIASGDRAYWLTPGWLENWDFIFKDWDAAKANETFPSYDKAIVLDGVGYFDELSTSKPERILEIVDWMKIPLEVHHVGLERLTHILSRQLD